MSGAPAIDAAAWNELMAGTGDDFARELASTFLGEAPAMLSALDDALRAGDAERFRRTAHSLKSNAATFGAFALAAHAKGLELGGLDAARRDGAALPALAAEWERVATTLAELAGG